MQEKEKYSFKDYMKFIIPSIIGILLLMIPFNYKGETTIIVAILANSLTELLGDKIPIIIVLIISIISISTIIYRLFLKEQKLDFFQRNIFLKGILNVSKLWMIVRFLGMIFVIFTYFKIGPEIIYSSETGGLILNDLLLSLFTVFLFAGFLLPFLTNFGLLEFIGVLLTPVMRPLFKLPGRSSVNAVVSWVGDGTIGVAFTNNQYIEGYYTAKEASIISTTFAAVSITFCLVVADQVGLSNMFGTFYLVVTLAGIIAALIMPRIPPLSKKPNSYYKEKNENIGEDIPEGYTKLEWGLKLAIDVSRENFNFNTFLTNGIKTVLDMWLGVLPVIMAFGTIGLILANYTPIFSILGIPFIPILKLMKVPYAKEVSKTIMIGFADMFLPSVIGQGIPDIMSRFIVGALSVTQLVYISEAGAVILGSEIPVSLLDLFIIFIQRTLITLPIITLAAHIIF